MDLKPARLTRRRMLGLMGAAAVVGPVSSTGETTMATDNDVRVLSQLEGEIYRTMRDDLFRRGGALGDLATRHGADPDWRVRTTAATLQGWAEQRNLYGTVLAEIDAVDPDARGRAITGILGVWEEFEMRAHGEFGPPILPLAWEYTVKFAATAPSWRTATFLAMMAGVPSEASVEPTAHVIETSDDQLLRERAALTLSKLPRDAVDRSLAGLSDRAAGIADAVRTARELLE